VEVSYTQKYYLPFFIFYHLILFFFLKIAINGSEAGLVLSTLFMATLAHFLALQTAETENNLTSVQRIMEYCKFHPEAPLESAASKPKLSHNYFSLFDGYIYSIRG